MINNRTIYQPLTNHVAKVGARREILGRSDFGEEKKDFGEEIVKSYVISRFCKPHHDVSAERVTMRKKALVLFAPATGKKPSKKQKQLKEKENVVNVLAAGIVKLTSGADGSMAEVQNLQIGNVPGLLADAEDAPYHLHSKSDLRKLLKDE